MIVDNDEKEAREISALLLEIGTVTQSLGTESLGTCAGLKAEMS